MIRTSTLVSLAALSLVAICDPARAATVVFSDSTFDNADYTHFTYTGGAGFTTSVGQGGPGADPVLVTTYEKTGPTSPSARFLSLNNTFVYDPSVQGAILSIDVAFDQQISLFHNTTPVNLAGGTAQARLLAEQDGKIYMAVHNAFTGLPFDSEYHVASTGFTANEFLLFDPANPFAPRTLTGLDFTGGAITFGFETAHFGVLVNGGPSTGLVRSRISTDDFRLTLNTQDPVGAAPEPATWLLMIGGFGLAGAALRRTRPSGAIFAP